MIELIERRESDHASGFVSSMRFQHSFPALDADSHLFMPCSCGEQDADRSGPFCLEEPDWTGQKSSRPTLPADASSHDRVV